MLLTFENKSAYKSSRSSEPILITGEFEITDKVLNGRTKVIQKDTEKVYWINSYKEDECVEEVTEEEKASSSTSSTHTKIKRFFVVSENDTFQSIAKIYGMTEDEIRERAGNSLEVSQKIFIGEM